MDSTLLLLPLLPLHDPVKTSRRQMWRRKSLMRKLMLTLLVLQIALSQIGLDSVAHANRSLHQRRFQRHLRIRCDWHGHIHAAVPAYFQLQRMDRGVAANLDQRSSHRRRKGRTDWPPRPSTPMARSVPKPWPEPIRLTPTVPARSTTSLLPPIPVHRRLASSASEIPPSPFLTA